MVVVVPAHDERDTIGLTVDSVVRALRHARRHRVVGPTSVRVVAHRCTDDTAQRARARLRFIRGAEVMVDDTSSTIGQVRDRGAREGLARLPWSPHSSWVFSTDADTCVPRDWVVRVLTAAGRHDAAAVVGLAALDRFRGTSAALASYDELLAAKMRLGDPLHQHDHVYGANLAVRADAYLGIGGFPHLPHGEDQQLVERLVESGTRVLRTREITVSTSGRLDGRAVDGLADLLRRLGDKTHVSDGPNLGTTTGARDSPDSAA